MSLRKSWQERRGENPGGGQGMCKLPKEKEEAGIRKCSSKFKMAVSWNTWGKQREEKRGQVRCGGEAEHEVLCNPS